MACEWCDGTGVYGHWDGPGRDPRPVPCSRCSGTGELEPLRAAVEASWDLRHALEAAAADGSAYARLWLAGPGRHAVAQSFGLHALAEGNYER